MTAYLDLDVAPSLRRVVIVAGHAVLRNDGAPECDDNWILLPFQKGEGRCYVEHVSSGVRLTAADPASLLVFSGGQSRREAGPRSEAQSYFWIADRAGWFGSPVVARRATTEEFSRDSFENLLFGICRFREVTGSYPEHVTFVGWAFKQQRFELHRHAIGWPPSRYTYIGANNPPAVEQALAAEAETHAKYAIDPYSSGEEYRAKRDARNPFRRQHGYAVSCPELAPLFAHAGPGLYEGNLPWSHS